MDYQSEEEEVEIVRKRVTLDKNEIIELAVAIARDTRKHPDVKLGSSVRGSIDMVDIYGKTLNGLGRSVSRDQIDDNLLLHSAMMSFRSKIWIDETSEKTPEEVIREIFSKLQKKK
jgi:MoxR-like ATPase